jgi:hypothetical protein
VLQHRARPDILAKVITLAHGRAGNGFGPVLRYLLRVERKDSLSRPTPESGHLHLTQEPFWSAAEDAREYAQDVAAVFDDQARQCRGRGRFRGNPVYHLAINWMEGEHLTLQQAERASRHVMRALGFGECQATAGDQAAQAALRGIRYRERRRERQEGIAGEEIAAQQPFTVGSLRAEVDVAWHLVIYRRADGNEVFRDVGLKILMRDKGDASLEAALRVAAQKYGGRVQLTGSEPFRERAARMATRLGIVVENAELQAIVGQERQRVAQRWVEPRVVPAFSPTNPSRARPVRSHGLER